MSFLDQIIIMNMIKKINIFKKDVKQMEFKKIKEKRKLKEVNILKVFKYNKTSKIN